MQKRIWEFIEEHPWIPIAIATLAIVISFVGLALIIGFRLAPLLQGS